ncbi:MAG: amidohydrolase family protein [Herpetosiphonaceae bacterium]|nr:amidohydrolase family protein [Herpetosiphonaceae bacterium]
MHIDAHHHFWHYHPDEYSWMTDQMESLKHDYLPTDLQPLLRRTGIEGTVVVQARQSLQETEWLLDLADQYPFIKGVVGWVDVCSPQARAQLATYAHRSKLKGVRHLVQDEPHDRFMLQPSFLAGIALLSEFKLVYDLLLYPKHLPVAVDVVKQFPQQQFVLDHLAKPFIKAQTLVPWETDIRALARFPNVVCKVSGLVTEAAWQQWQPADFRRYLDVVFDCFGPERLMFGSDWPVCTLAASYAEVVLLVHKYLRGLPIATQDQIFGGTAARVYGLL